MDRLASQEEREAAIAKAASASAEDVVDGFIDAYAGCFMAEPLVRAALLDLVVRERECAARQQRIEIRERARKADDARDFVIWCIEELESR